MKKRVDREKKTLHDFKWFEVYRGLILKIIIFKCFYLINFKVVVKILRKDILGNSVELSSENF